jgi:hypothetical protein
LSSSDAEFATQTLLSLVPDAKQITATTLSGGVSCDTIKVNWNNGSGVIKRALAQLRVPGTWEADVDRILAEGDAITMYHQLTPEFVPKLLGRNDDKLAIMLELASDDMELDEPEDTSTKPTSKGLHIPHQQSLQTVNQPTSMPTNTAKFITRKLPDSFRERHNLSNETTTSEPPNKTLRVSSIHTDFVTNETWRINNVELGNHKLEIFCNEQQEELVSQREPILSEEDVRNFDVNKLRRGMALEMTSMKDFDVYDSNKFE